MCSCAIWLEESYGSLLINLIKRVIFTFHHSKSNRKSKSLRVGMSEPFRVKTVPLSRWRWRLPVARWRWSFQLRRLGPIRPIIVAPTPRKPFNTISRLASYW